MVDIQRHITIVGNPNAGKSSIFNSLTGMNQKISNVTGTTIENKEGLFEFEEKAYKIYDTPGSYSLNPKSLDEQLAVSIFVEKKEVDLIVYVADASSLRRNLYYFSQLTTLKKPMLLILTFVDVAREKGIDIDTDRLEKELGIPVLATNPRSGQGMDVLKEHLSKDYFVPHGLVKSEISKDKNQAFVAIDSLLEKVQKVTAKSVLLTPKIDKILLHPIFGYFVFLVVLLTVFQAVFTLAAYPTEWIEMFFSFVSSKLQVMFPDHWLKSLIINGLLAGISGVLVFIPQILLMFFFIGILEDTGYMARISMLTDRVLRKFGLHGKSVIPLLSGVACAIPAIMSTRSIENWKERLITILVTPLMACSARVPVYTILISLIVPKSVFYFGISGQALAMLGLYFLGTATALVVALLLDVLLRVKGQSFFIMELPTYQIPRWKNVFILCYQKSYQFVAEAGKIILILSMIIWFTASYKPHPEKYFAFQPTEDIAVSYAGIFGKKIEPAIAPLGFDWKIGIALLTSFAAREVFVGTLSTIYSVGDEDNFSLLRDKLIQAKNEKGNPVFSLPTVVSLLLFYAYALQCISTMAVVKRETGGWKWPIVQFVFMALLAYASSFLAYQLLSVR